MRLADTLTSLPGIQDNSEIPLDLEVDHIALAKPSWPNYIRRLTVDQCSQLYTDSPFVDGLKHEDTSPIA